MLVPYSPDLLFSPDWLYTPDGVIIPDGEVEPGDPTATTGQFLEPRPAGRLIYSNPEAPQWTPSPVEVA